MEKLAFLLNELWEQTLGTFFNPAHFLSGLHLSIAFAIGLVFLMFQGMPAAHQGQSRLSYALGQLFARRTYLHRSARHDYAVFVINNLILWIIAASAIFHSGTVYSATLAAAQSIALEPVSVVPTVGMKFLYSFYLLLLWDFGASYSHYLKHKIPVLWELHKVHHSAEVLNPVTAVRRHPIEAIFGGLVVAVVSGVGIAGWALVMGDNIPHLQIFGTYAGVWLWRVFGYNLRHTHVWISYGPFWNRILISPAHHQIHHSKSPDHYDRNFGHIFAFWDHLFGTLYCPKAQEHIEFGIEEEEQDDYRTLKGLYVVPLVKIWRRMFGDQSRLPAHNGAQPGGQLEQGR